MWRLALALAALAPAAAFAPGACARSVARRAPLRPPLRLQAAPPGAPPPETPPEAPAGDIDLMKPLTPTQQQEIYRRSESGDFSTASANTLLPVKAALVITAIGLVFGGPIGDLLEANDLVGNKVF